MLARDICTSDVSTISYSKSLREAAVRMRNAECGCLPVERDDRMIGMITDRDIIVRGIAEGKDPDSTTVEELMTKGIVYAFDDQSIDDIAELMSKKKVRRLPLVTRAKRLVGIVSIGDIALAEERAKSSAQAEERYWRMSGEILTHVCH